MNAGGRLGAHGARAWRPPRLAALALVALACAPAWVAHSALATIPGGEGAANHLAVALVALAFAVVLADTGLRALGLRAPSRPAAALLLPLACRRRRVGRSGPSWR